jgi:hypothetical protein
LELKVQAWLDGELPDHEARRIGEWIARDAEASALAAELGCVKQAMFRNEAPPAGRKPGILLEQNRTPDSARSRPGRTDGTPWYARWRNTWRRGRRGGAGLCAVDGRPAGGTPTFDEISSTGEGMEAVTFHDQSAQMTVTLAARQQRGGWKTSQRSRKPVRSEDEPGR